MLALRNPYDVLCVVLRQLRRCLAIRFGGRIERKYNTTLRSRLLDHLAQMSKIRLAHLALVICCLVSGRLNFIQRAISGESVSQARGSVYNGHPRHHFTSSSVPVLGSKKKSSASQTFPNMRVWLSAIAWSSAWLHQVDSSACQP